MASVTESTAAPAAGTAESTQTQPDREATSGASAGRSRARLPALVRTAGLPAALAVVAAVYLGVAQHSPLTPGVVLLCAGAAVLGLVVQYIVGAADALVRGPDAAADRASIGRRRRDLVHEKAAILKALKELEFDHRMGKVGDQDFREMDERLRARARRVLRALDEAGGYRAALDEELRRRRAEVGAGSKAAKKDGGR